MNLFYFLIFISHVRDTITIDVPFKLPLSGFAPVPSKEPAGPTPENPCTSSSVCSEPCLAYMADGLTALKKENRRGALKSKDLVADRRRFLEKKESFHQYSNYKNGYFEPSYLFSAYIDTEQGATAFGLSRTKDRKESYEKSSQKRLASIEALLYERPGRFRNFPIEKKMLGIEELFKSRQIQRGNPLERYTIVNEIATGGFSKVYKIKRKLNGKKDEFYAMKVVPIYSQPSIAKEILMEARIFLRIQEYHEHLKRISIGCFYFPFPWLKAIYYFNGMLIFIMEYVKGTPICYTPKTTTSTAAPSSFEDSVLDSKSVFIGTENTSINEESPKASCSNTVTVSTAIRREDGSNQNQLDEPVPRTGLNELIYTLFEQILMGLEILRHLGVVHHDLKGENILWDPTAQEIRIVDYGASLFLDPYQLYYRDKIGTSYVTPPESYFLSNEKTPLEALKTFDVYSFGILVRYFLCNAFPEKVTHPYEARKGGHPKHFNPKTYGKRFMTLANRCLSKDYRQRPTIPALLAALKTTNVDDEQLGSQGLALGCSMSVLK